MFDEDDNPRPAALVLDRMSVEDLEKRIADLRDEIRLCEAELEKKRAHKSAADALFKPGG